MLYYFFKSYEDFKETFGVIEHGNGEKSRRNKILLALLKSRQFFKDIDYLPNPENGCECIPDYIATEIKKRVRNITSMAALREFCIRRMRDFDDPYGNRCVRNDIRLSDDGIRYVFWTNLYQVDNEGICFDGDFSSIRYINLDNGKPYKMNAGKFLRRLIEENHFGNILPEQVKVWLCEDFAERWRSYCAEKADEYQLHISEDEEDFMRIYDDRNYVGDFFSCMSHERGRQSYFYTNSVKAKAAWLKRRDDDGIVARCVIFTDVYDEDGNKWRLAERQYSSNGDNMLKRMLVEKLIAAGEIDGYKQIGVDCHSARAYVANDGSSLEDRKFWIECELEDGESTLSYQDSFKYYNEHTQKAFNYHEEGADIPLDNTDMVYNPHANERWSEYNGEWINEDYAVWVEHRNDYFREHQTLYCENTRQREFEDDCVPLGDECDDRYLYYGENRCGDVDDVFCCDHCGYYYPTDMRGHSTYIDDDLWLCSDCMRDAVEEYKEEHPEEFIRDEVEGDLVSKDELVNMIKIHVFDYEKNKRREGYTRSYNRHSSRVVFWDEKYFLGNIAVGYNHEKVPAEAVGIKWTHRTSEMLGKKSEVLYFIR